ncbi:hypothetical protein [Lutibaculum baratangense]|uniref:hypothetical protein n=1 Tax=Lutibaculum baratangense TaxID=1358440 RepID=UPI00058B78F6|nr:hypothetical protein [Lutibaculum baratangense]
MAMKPVAFALSAWLAAIGAAMADADDVVGELLLKMRLCRSVERPDQRLACFEKLAGSVRAGRHAERPVPGGDSASRGDGGTAGERAAVPPGDRP